MKNITRIECADELSDRLRKGATILRSLKEPLARQTSRLFNANLEQFANDCEEAARLLYHSRIEANRVRNEIQSGTFKLADIRTEHLEMRCSKCGLAGNLPVDDLIAIYGAEYRLADLTTDMGIPCNDRFNRPCGISFVNLEEN